MGHLFLSYRSNEIDFAFKLATDLKNAGVVVWMDRLDIQPGDDWRNSLQKGIDKSTAIMPLLSPDYVASRYCRRELARADRLNNPVVPILLVPLEDVDVPIEVEREQYIDFTAWQDPKTYNKLFKKLLKHLKERFPQLVTSQPDSDIRYLNNLISELESSLSLTVSDEETEERPQRQHFLPNLKQAALGWTASSTEAPSFSQLWEALQAQPRLLITGASGLGKTTLMRYLALQLAYARRNKTIEIMPRWFSLQNWGISQTWEDFIQQGEATPNIAFFLDDLDALSGHPERLALLRHWIENIPTYVILGSRSVHHLAQWPFLQVELVAMDYTQIIAYVDHQLASARQWLKAESPLLPLAGNRLYLNYLLEQAAIPEEAPLGKLLAGLLGHLWDREAKFHQRFALTYADFQTDLAHVALAKLQNQKKEPPKHTFSLEVAENLNILREDHLEFTNDTWMGYFAARHPAFPLEQATLEAKQAPWNIALTCWLGLAQDPDLALLQVHQISPSIAFAHLLNSVTVSDATATVIIRSWLQDHPNLLPATLAGRLQAWDVEQGYRVLLALQRQGTLSERIHAYHILAQLEQPLVDLSAVWTHLEEEFPEIASEILQTVGESARFTLFKGLQDSNPQIRRWAAWGLGELRDTANLPALITALGDKDEQVVVEACYALGMLRNEASYPALVDLLAHPKAHMAAYRTLEWLGEESIPALKISLEHPSVKVRLSAIQLLRQWFTPLADELLLHASHDAKLEVQLAAIEAFEKRENEAMLKRLKAVLNDQHLAEVAKRILATLKPQLDKPVDPAQVAKERLKRVVRQPDSLPEFDSHAPQNDFLLPLLKQLKSPWGEREQAAKAIRAYAKEHQHSHRDDILEHLQRALAETSDWTIQASLIESLAWLGDKRAAPHILPFVENEHWMVRSSAIYSLAELGEVSALEKIRQCVHDEHRMVSEAAIEAIGILSDTESLPNLVRLMTDSNSDPFLRLAAVETLGQIQDKRVLGSLCLALNDPDKHVRWVAMNLLVNLADAEAEPALIQALADTDSPHWEVRRVCDLAAEALQKLGTENALAALANWRSNPLLTSSKTPPETG